MVLLHIYYRLLRNQALTVGKSQGMSTAGDCRYRQAIPVGGHGRLDVNTNYGLRRSFLPQVLNPTSNGWILIVHDHDLRPFMVFSMIWCLHPACAWKHQGRRRYIPLQQPTAQKVLIDTVSAGPTVLFVIGSHTNIALFLMTNPHLKKNIEHIYIMGGGVRSKNPCCTNNASTSCERQHCDDKGNLFTGYTSNPYAEFNIFGDPFAAYQVNRPSYMDLFWVEYSYPRIKNYCLCAVQDLI